MFEHLPSHGSELVLNSVEHAVTGIVKPQDDTFPSYYCDICCVAAFGTFESHDLHQFCCYVVFKSRSRGLLISMCFCLERLTTWYTSCQLCYGVVDADCLQISTHV